VAFAPYPDITSPVLLLDERTCRRNIERMAAIARKNSVHFRPHVKTHQSRSVASWLRDEGVDSITVSSVSMAEYFADDGWTDITIAFPHNPRETARVDRLAGRCRLGILVESPRVVRHLQTSLGNTVDIFIKIDTGYGRTGVAFDNTALLDPLLDAIESAPRLHFAGLLTHGGDSYHAAGPEEVRRYFDTARIRLAETASFVRERHPDAIVSVGDTPGCSLAGEFSGIDEIRPGNFVFYDIMQLQLGACRVADIAVAVAAPVVAVHPNRGEAVIHCGSVHLSKEASIDASGNPSFGRVVFLTENGWTEPAPGTVVRSLSQEHGIITTTDEILALLHEGVLLGILPVHSCLTAQCMRGYLTLDGTVADHFAGIPFSLPWQGAFP
jgi:D-serine deaminase-like pyridoxal phosphate-dependent protein